MIKVNVNDIRVGLKFLRFGLGRGNLELVGYGIKHGCSWVYFQACYYHYGFSLCI